MVDLNSVKLAKPLESALFFSKPNRSLSKKGRSLWFALIFASTMLVAGAASVIGAWLVLPFAGIEVALVWIAFRMVGRHDADYEVLRVDALSFRWEQRCGSEVAEIAGNREWATFECWNAAHKCRIHLNYGGRQVELGQLMSRQQRERLAVDLGQVFKRIS